MTRTRWLLLILSGCKSAISMAGLDEDPTERVSAWRQVSAVVRGGVLRSVAELKAAAPKP